MRDTRSIPQAERGSAVFSMLVIVLVLAAVALAVDIGRLASEKRSLQKAVDIAALSAVNASGFCGPSSSAMETRLRDVARGVLVENGFDPDEEGNRWDLHVGHAATSDGRRKFVITGGIENPRTDSVMVRAAKTVSSSLFVGGWLGQNRQEIAAVGAARNQAAASYAVGSQLVALDSSDSTLLDALLSGLLGSDIDLGVAGYDGLVNTKVTLLDLKNAAPLVGIDLVSGSTSSLLEAEVSVSQFLSLLARAVESGGHPNAALVEMLEKQVVSTDQTIRLGEVLGSAPDADLSRAEVGVAELLMAGLLAGVRDDSLQIPLGLTLAQLSGSVVDGVSVDTASGGVRLDLDVIEPPQVAVGPPGKRDDGAWRTVARTAQAELTLRVPINVQVPGSVQPVKVLLTVGMQLAQGQGALASLTCPTWDDPAAYATIAVQPGLAQVDIALDLRLAGSSIMAMDAPVDLQDSTSLQEFAIPPEGDAWKVSPGSASPDTRIGYAITNQLYALSDAQFVNSQLNLTGLPELVPLDELSASITTAVATQLAPVLTELDDTVIDPALGVLGLQVARADIPIDSLGREAGEAELAY